MEDKEGMKKAVAGVMTEAPADGRKPATASNLPPPYLTGGYGNRNGGQGSGSLRMLRNVHNGRQRKPYHFV
ncbi:hypothetical protein F9Z36_2137 [Neisseria gonorrhoeae]|uniref:Uncharacterized protein n=1 Tax=Neisseria gonorrhoeae (strain NCCP11945) TaxID=521006 RepID=B4RM31_NEIG2|nr:Hypothetical protein NGK_1193 [Neisseria gonorrhoeae NCCP11945]KAE9496570.1 hypothetical protein F9Z36_2137 [Neisseria gonorrhoeae]